MEQETRRHSGQADVMPRITTDQRRDFRRWSDAFGKIDADTKAKEAEAWMVSALSILNRHNAGLDRQKGAR
jgi:hypothetical protein